MWLEHFVLQNEAEETVELAGIKTLELFQEWKHMNNIKYETNAIKIGFNLSNLKIKGITKAKHTKNGSTKIYDITVLKKHFGIGCLINNYITEKKDTEENAPEDCDIKTK